MIRSRLARRLLGPVLWTAVAIGCDSPAAPSPGGGTYRGTVESPSFAGVGTFELTLTRAGTVLSGTFRATFMDGSNEGALEGSLIGSRLSAVLTSRLPEVCPLALEATLTGSTLTGSYVSFDCRIEITGVISLQRVDP